jgi:hypothetical protein
MWLLSSVTLVEKASWRAEIRITHPLLEISHRGKIRRDKDDKLWTIHLVRRILFLLDSERKLRKRDLFVPDCTNWFNSTQVVLLDARRRRRRGGGEVATIAMMVECALADARPQNSAMHTSCINKDFQNLSTNV